MNSVSSGTRAKRPAFQVKLLMPRKQTKHFTRLHLLAQIDLELLYFEELGIFAACRIGRFRIRLGHENL